MNSFANLFNTTPNETCGTEKESEVLTFGNFRSIPIQPIMPTLQIPVLIPSYSTDLSICNPSINASTSSPTTTTKESTSVIEINEDSMNINDLPSDISTYFISETQKLSQTIEQLIKDFMTSTEQLVSLSTELATQNYEILRNHLQLQEVSDTYDLPNEALLEEKYREQLIHDIIFYNSNDQHKFEDIDMITDSNSNEMLVEKKASSSIPSRRNALYPWNDEE